VNCAAYAESEIRRQRSSAGRTPRPALPTFWLSPERR